MNCRLTLASLALAAGAAATTHAAVLLQIDVSNPAAVRFISTSNLGAFDSVKDTDSDGGFTIENFLTETATIPAGSPVTGTLTPFLNGNAVYNQFGTYEYASVSNFSEGNDLKIYTADSYSQLFSNENPVFSGEATIDFSSYLPLLPAVGTSGNIYPGYTYEQEPAVGQWQVVNTAIPEPSTYAAGAGLLALGLVVYTRRRKS